MQDFDATLGIFSHDDFLTEKLKEKFNDKYVDVKVFSSFEKVELSEFNYLVINLLNENYNLSEVTKVIPNLKCKIIVLFPLSVQKEDKVTFEKKLENLINLNPNLGVILVPEILGSTVKFNKNYISHNVIMQSLTSVRVKVKSEGGLINSISVTKLVERIVKETLSFGVVGQKVALIGPKRGAKTFASKYLGLSDENIVVSAGDDNLETLKYDFTSSVDFSLRLAVRNTKKAFLKALEEVEVLIPPKKITYSRSKNINFEVLSKLLLFILALYVLPLLLIIVSGTLLFASTKYIFTNPNVSQKLISASSSLAIFTSQFNFNNDFYYNSSSIIQKSSNLVNETLALSNSTSSLATLVLGDHLYDLNSQTNNISASLDKIHTNISFLQSDISELNSFFGKTLNNYLEKKNINIKDSKLKVFAVKNLASRMTTLLGSEKQTKYLLLFQNNMELRPTGGFIGSYAILTFDQGRMSDIVVSDVYSADGQLKGHVDPPEPIRKYLGEGGWFLRDSNWDPNFPESAEKIEWFLDKEVNQKVDGVIAVDLNFVKGLLDIIGPINLPDFDKTITAENLYIETQNEVHEEFFPGSIKKASFLTSLSKSLISEIENLPSEKNFALLNEMYKSLEEKHIQMFMHDKNTQEALTALNFTGELDMETDCNLRCYKDKYLVVDANLGVNKANYFIKKSEELNVTVSKVKINHELLINYQNSAAIALGSTGKYKTYTRLIIPTNSKMLGVREYNQDGSYFDVPIVEEMVGGRKEVGFLIEVSPMTEKRIQLAWDIETNIFENGGEYNLTVLKQAGTDGNKLKVVLRESDLSLTGRASPVYNTVLTRDYRLKVFFK